MAIEVPDSGISLPFGALDQIATPGAAKSGTLRFGVVGNV